MEAPLALEPPETADLPAVELESPIEAAAVEEPAEVSNIKSFEETLEALAAFEINDTGVSPAAQVETQAGPESNQPALAAEPESSEETLESIETIDLPTLRLESPLETDKTEESAPAVEAEAHEETLEAPVPAETIWGMDTPTLKLDNQAEAFETMETTRPDETKTVEIAPMAAARAAEERQNYQDAYQVYARILESEPDHASAWMGKGRSAAWLSTSDEQFLDEAAACFKQAIEIGVSDPVELTIASDYFSSAALGYTRQLIASLTQKYKPEIPEPKTSWFSRIFKSTNKPAPVEIDTARFSEDFRALQLPILNSLWFCWWHLSRDLVTADNIYQTIKALKNTPIETAFQDAFIRTLSPVLIDIKVRFPAYDPYIKVPVTLEAAEPAGAEPEMVIYNPGTAEPVEAALPGAVQVEEPAAAAALDAAEWPSVEAPAGETAAEQVPPAEEVAVVPAEPVEAALPEFSQIEEPAAEAALDAAEWPSVEAPLEQVPSAEEVTLVPAEPVETVLPEAVQVEEPEAEAALDAAEWPSWETPTAPQTEMPAWETFPASGTLEKLTDSEPQQADATISLWENRLGESIPLTETGEMPAASESDSALDVTIPLEKAASPEMIYLDQARVYEANLQYQEASLLYARVLDINPQHASAWLGQGRVSAWLSTPDEQRLEEASAYFEKAILNGAAETGQLAVTSASFSSATLAYTGALLAFLEQKCRSEKSVQKFNLFSWISGAARRQAQETLQERLSDAFWPYREPILHSLWFCWWQLSASRETAGQIDALLKLLKDAGISPAHLETFIQTLSPIKANIEVLFPGMDLATWVEKSRSGPAHASQALGSEVEPVFIVYDLIQPAEFEPNIAVEQPFEVEPVETPAAAHDEGGMESEPIQENDKNELRSSAVDLETVKLSKPGPEDEAAAVLPAEIETFSSQPAPVEVEAALGETVHVEPVENVVAETCVPAVEPGTLAIKAVDETTQAGPLEFAVAEAPLPVEEFESPPSETGLDDTMSIEFVENSVSGTSVPVESFETMPVAADETVRSETIENVAFEPPLPAEEPAPTPAGSAPDEIVQDELVDIAPVETPVSEEGPETLSFETAVAETTQNEPVENVALEPPVPAAEPALITAETAMDEPVHDEPIGDEDMMMPPIFAEEPAAMPVETTVDEIHRVEPLENDVPEAPIPVEEIAIAEEPPLPPEVLLFESARTSEKNKHYAEAYADYGRVLELMPEHAAAWMGKGRCAAQMSTPDEQRLDETVACFKQAQELGLLDPEDCKNAADLLALAVVKHTRELVPYLSRQLRYEIPAPAIWVIGKARQKAEDEFSDRLSERFWANKLPLINSLWFAWWGLSKDSRVAGAVYDVVKALKNSTLALNYQEAFAKTLDPILADIKVTLPRFRPPFKIKFETSEDETEDGQAYASTDDLQQVEQPAFSASADLNPDSGGEAGIPPVETAPSIHANTGEVYPEAESALGAEFAPVEEPSDKTVPVSQSQVVFPAGELPEAPGTEPAPAFSAADAAAYENRKQYPEAINAYNRLLEVDPENASLWMAKGRCAARASTVSDQQLDEAVISYKKALDTGAVSTDELKTAAIDLSSATLAFTQDLAQMLAEDIRQSMPAPRANLFSKALGLDRKQMKEAFSEAFSKAVWEYKLPILNSLWFCWWGLSKELVVVEDIYTVIKTLRDAGMTPDYEEAFIHTLLPVLADIRAKFPGYKPPIKLDSDYEEDMSLEETVHLEQAAAVEEPAGESAGAVEEAQTLPTTIPPAGEETFSSAADVPTISTADENEPAAAFENTGTLFFNLQPEESVQPVKKSRAEKRRARNSEKEVGQEQQAAAAEPVPENADGVEVPGAPPSAQETDLSAEPMIDTAGAIEPGTAFENTETLFFSLQPQESGQPVKKSRAEKRRERNNARTGTQELPSSVPDMIPYSSETPDVQTEPENELNPSPTEESIGADSMETPETTRASFETVEVTFSRLEPAFQQEEVSLDQATIPAAAFDVPAEILPEAPEEQPGEQATIRLADQKTIRGKKKSRSRNRPEAGDSVTITQPPAETADADATVRVERATFSIANEAISMAAARTAEEARHYQQAVDAFSEVLESNPDHAAAWLGKGRCTAWLSAPGQERLDDSVSCMKKALEIGISDSNELKTASGRLGAATFLYTRSLVAALSQKHGVEAPAAKNGLFGRFFGGPKVAESVSNSLSEEFWGLTMPIFNSLFFCWRLSNDLEIANDIYDTIQAVRSSAVAKNYQEAFMETFEPVLAEIKTKYPKYKPPK